MQQCWLTPARVLAWFDHVTWADVGSFERVRVPSAGGVGEARNTQSFLSPQDILPATYAQVV
ncbi:hypothetical protein COCMIDRAFT_107573 [Bipolaris oryzae ATCC 44560]|uniref:Uncharacterized protein n=1 Tax=Bipolaris oryzae ATCC 44560 TaxID=930090 RepID=W6YZE7_COCMI|nr:uncharacterized protein COCMIDRAFT_107573 [Bipolaris oryzae ATCC 44560]EUC40904.1 hypothetical protein COCMIDRAFT_107573 [Bipolaris oryzae ATCC 44560]